MLIQRRNDNLSHAGVFYPFRLEPVRHPVPFALVHQEEHQEPPLPGRRRRIFHGRRASFISECTGIAIGSGAVPRSFNIVSCRRLRFFAPGKFIQNRLRAYPEKLSGFWA
jgi:hypothetical protein